MGCDGGTIPRRDELVKVKKKPEAVSLYLLTNLAKVEQLSFATVERTEM